ncbi:hypothetical protein BT96DRAFT_949000 [Gymnopus androsaceus JB14]|uniref:Uncharacterized protein n=1 Tax=Gymnopus androsaceus JB14 TaxID=1447944 RepID=A0A6A4GLF1_9AGAR|nr:hypothetical protein BT96DRAFT_949000 [Gymnopus androsaceus JB14]
MNEDEKDTWYITLDPGNGEGFGEKVKSTLEKVHVCLSSNAFSHSVHGLEDTAEVTTTRERMNSNQPMGKKLTERDKSRLIWLLTMRRMAVLLDSLEVLEGVEEELSGDDGRPPSGDILKSIIRRVLQEKGGNLTYIPPYWVLVANFTSDHPHYTLRAFKQKSGKKALYTAHWSWAKTDLWPTSGRHYMNFYHPKPRGKVEVVL